MQAPTRRAFLRDLGLGAGVLLLAACGQAAQPPATPVPAAAKPAAATGTTPAAASGGKSNGSKITAWGWQSFTPEGDKALGDQMQAWGAANNTQVEYVVVENSQFPQKLAAAVEAKADAGKRAAKPDAKPASTPPAEAKPDTEKKPN